MDIDFSDPRWVVQYDWTDPGPEVEDEGVFNAKIAEILLVREWKTLDPRLEWLGKVIQQIRRHRNNTQISVAQVAGLHPVALVLLEQGILNSEEVEETLYGLSPVLGVDPKHLRFAIRQLPDDDLILKVMFDERYEDWRTS